MTVAQSQFGEGDFTRAQASFEDAVRLNPGDPEARLGAATLELYRNELGNADRNLAAVLRLDPSNGRARALRDAIGERRGARGTFDAHFANPAGAEIPFASSVPLPTVRARIADREVVLAIDTTAPGLLLAPALAAELGTGSGRDAAIDRLELGSAVIRKVPVRVGSVSGLSGDHDRIEGAIGPLFFSHFLVTIDYARQVLIVRPAGASRAFARDAQKRHASSVSMWLAPESDLFAQARINAAPPGLFNLDSRDMQNGVAITPQTMQRAHLTFDHAKFEPDARGQIRRIPFTANLTIGSLTVSNLNGALQPLGMSGGAPFLVAGSIGAPAFAALAVTFDFAAMHLIVERSANPVRRGSRTV